MTSEQCIVIAQDFFKPHPTRKGTIYCAVRRGSVPCGGMRNIDRFYESDGIREAGALHKEIQQNYSTWSVDELRAKGKRLFELSICFKHINEEGKVDATVETMLEQLGRKPAQPTADTTLSSRLCISCEQYHSMY